MSQPFPRLSDRPGPSIGDYLLYLAGVLALVVALTWLWLSMRAVMNTAAPAHLVDRSRWPFRVRRAWTCC
jgi:hypothetical protein